MRRTISSIGLPPPSPARTHGGIVFDPMFTFQMAVVQVRVSRGRMTPVTLPADAALSRWYNRS